MRCISRGEKLNNESSNMLKAPRQHLAVLASGCKLKITKAWDSQFDALRQNEKCLLFLIRDKGNVCQPLCEDEEYTETSRKNM